MAKTTNITKAELQDNLEETKAELKEAKDALKDAMDVIADMKKKLEEQPQVTVVQQPAERRTNSKIRCISLSYDPLNLSTMPNGQGRVFSFKNYGQSMYIKYDDMLDVLSSYPNTVNACFPLHSFPSEFFTSTPRINGISLSIKIFIVSFKIINDLSSSRFNKIGFNPLPSIC